MTKKHAFSKWQPFCCIASKSTRKRYFNVRNPARSHFWMNNTILPISSDFEQYKSIAIPGLEKTLLTPQRSTATDIQSKERKCDDPLKTKSGYQNESQLVDVTRCGGGSDVLLAKITTPKSWIRSNLFCLFQIKVFAHNTTFSICFKLEQAFGLKTLQFAGQEVEGKSLVTRPSWAWFQFISSFRVFSCLALLCSFLSLELLMYYGSTDERLWIHSLSLFSGTRYYGYTTKEKLLRKCNSWMLMRVQSAEQYRNKLLGEAIFVYFWFQFGSMAIFRICPTSVRHSSYL